MRTEFKCPDCGNIGSRIGSMLFKPMEIKLPNGNIVPNQLDRLVLICSNCVKKRGLRKVKVN